jgi:hypothetical protein
MASQRANSLKQATAKRRAAGTKLMRNGYTSAMTTPPFDAEPGPTLPSRRAFLHAATLAVSGLVLAPSVHAQAPVRAMTVYKDPNCGCCKEWVTHVRKAGFTVTVRDTADMESVKASFGVPAGLGSCHTARVGTYTIEGHVPADLIVKLLKDKPVARGLAVPGMPMGSPGMEQGGQKDAYDVLLFDKAGKSRVYASR